METKPKPTNDKVLETTTHEYLKIPYTVLKETKNRKILYTGIVKLSERKPLKKTKNWNYYKNNQTIT